MKKHNFHETNITLMIVTSQLAHIIFLLRAQHAVIIINYILHINFVMSIVKDYVALNQQQM